jgi:hypothetical protein
LGTKKGWIVMDFSPAQVWEDGSHMLNNAEDRAGALLIGIFAAVLSLWIIPETLKHIRSR